MRRKQIGLILAAALILSACGSVNTKIDSENTATDMQTEEVGAQDAESEGMTPAESESQSMDATAPGTEPVWREMNRFPLNVAMMAEYEGEWDDKGPIITADCSRIVILDDGYESLKNTVEAYNDRNWQEVSAMYTENLEYAKSDTLPEGTSISISREVEIMRADSSVLSFINAEHAYLGGAHGSYYENGETFDAETGTALALEDVVTDVDSVYKYVKTYLKEQYEPSMFFEGYEEWLEEMFYEPESATASPLEWVVTVDGVEFRFSPYVFGPWAAGTFEVILPYEGNEELFAEKYIGTVERPIVKVEPETPIAVDTDGDGKDETVWYTIEWDENQYLSCITVVREDADADRKADDADDKRIAADSENSGADSESVAAELKVDNIYGWNPEVYLVRSKENVPYLYVEFLLDNDWERMEIIRLGETEGNYDMEHIGTTRNAFYGHFVSDSDCFTLYERIDILGTYMVYRNYEVGTDGMPISEQEMFTIVNGYFDWDSALTSKRELSVMMHMEGDDEKVEETLPKGTKFRPCRTDGKTMIEMELEDGRRCDILLEKETDDYIFYIDGVSEYDCFEMLPYAG